MTSRFNLKGPLALMAKNPVAANLLMVTFIVGGLLMSFKIRREVFPSTEMDMILVSVAYPGASPSEVESGIILAIEDSARGIDGVKEVRSNAREGLGSVIIELTTRADKTKAMSDVKNAVDRITTFPENAEKPVVSLPEMKMEAIWLVLFGDQSEKILFELGERVREDLLASPDVSYVEMDGVLPLEISVEVPQNKLRAHGISLPQIASAIKKTAMELPAGAVKTSGGEIMLRTTERRDLGFEFSDVPIIVNKDGSQVKLGDLATIKDGFAEIDLEARFEGKTCVFIKVYSVGNESPTETATAVKKMVAELKKKLPPGVSAATWMDFSKLYDDRLDLMLRNASIGLVLVLLILGLFLELRLAFWVTMGIPISFLGSFLFLPALGISLNMISMFAFIVTLGMVVDDAIVIGENIYYHRQKKVPLLKASVLGARQMSVPVFFSIATTIAAFAPLLFVPGMRGKFMLAIPVVAIIVLAISLIESFFILPSHLAHLNEEGLKPRFERFVKKPFFPQAGHGFEGFLNIFLSAALLPFFMIFKGFSYLMIPLLDFQSRFSKSFSNFAENKFGPVSAMAIRNKWITMALGISIFTICLGLLSGGHVKQIDFPKEESDWVFVNASFPFGHPVSETKKFTKLLVDKAKEVVDENGGKKISHGTFSVLGSATIRGSKQTGTHVTMAGVFLVSSDKRDIGSHKFADLWRKKLGQVPGLETLEFNASTGHGESPPIAVKLSHNDPLILAEAAKDLSSHLGKIEGVIDVDNGIELGKRQLDFTLSKEGIAAGFTTYDLASQVRASFYGAEALRQQRGRNEIKVLVKLPRDERSSLYNVENLMVMTKTGGEMPLLKAAKVNYGRAYTTIRRTDGRRTLVVKAQVVEGKANAKEVFDSVKKNYLPVLKTKYPGLNIFKSGRQKSMQEFMDFLLVGYSFALLAMFVLIAIPLKSYLQPIFVVMIAIPFGLVGAVLGHLLMGLNISMISWMGMVALSGVVVNDSLVFVTAANRYKESGMSAFEAAHMAAKRRLRPILLTSITTFGGLMPMILETSVQARILIPMAVTLGFGVMFATLIILFIVPSLFVIVEIPRDFFKRGKIHD